MKKWNLETIYPSFESDKYQSELESVKKHIEDLKSFEFGDDFTKTAKSFIEKTNSTMALLFPLSVYAFLKNSVDSADYEALSYLDKLSAIQADLTTPMVKMQKWLTNYSEEEILNNTDPIIKEHSFMLKESRKNAKHLLTDDQESLLSILSSVGSDAWSNLQAQQTGDLEVSFELDGKTQKLTLSMLRNLAHNESQDVRKRAYEAEIEAYKQIDEAVGASLNAIKGGVNLVSKLRGYESALEESVSKASIDFEILNVMIDAMKEKLPVFRKYLKRKAKILGHKNGLPWYDLYAPINDVKLHYTYDEAKQFVIENFGSFSEELKNLAQTAFNDEWIDVEPRKGKRGGAFCSNVPMYNQSRVMLNFQGSFGDVTTMAHELGHAYHNSQVYNETPLNSDYPMTLAETASIFCETIVTNSAVKQATPEAAIYILEKSIENSTAVIVDILSRFIFENSLFEERKNGPVSVEKLKELMINAQKETYGDGLDQNCLHPYMWANKPHYYSAGFNFYNYPYAFGLLFALGLYAIYESGEPDFAEKYNKVLQNTTRMNAKDVAKGVGIDISKKDFWLDSLGIVEKHINEFIKLTDSQA